MLTDGIPEIFHLRLNVPVLEKKPMHIVFSKAKRQLYTNNVVPLLVYLLSF